MPDQPQPPDVAFVDDPGAVADALASVAADVVGVDVERADADRYFRRAALVQVGIAGRCALFDGVAIETLPELDAFLGPGRLTVLHAAENDLEPLAAMAVRPARVADTAVAAALLGLPTGLGILLSDLLDVEADGDKSAFQRADWAARPLSSPMAAYAAGDVVHLPALWAQLSSRLEAAGRTSWYQEELTWIVRRAADDTRAWIRVKGAGRLTPRQRAVLRALWEERERIARDQDLAPNRLLHDDVLRDLASDPPRTEAQLVRRSHRRRSLLRAHAPALLAAVERGLGNAPELSDGGPRRWSDRDRAMFDALRQARAEVAVDLGLDPGVLCPSRALWLAIGGSPEDGRDLCQLAGLRSWQTDLLADPLWKAYTTAGVADDEERQG